MGANRPQAPSWKIANVVAARPLTAYHAAFFQGAHHGIFLQDSAQLEKLAAANPQKLNWKTSIVDLLKLLDLDSSLAARKELAAELNVRAGADGSAEQNIALHKAVLAKLAANGGNVPADLL